MLRKNAIAPCLALIVLLAWTAMPAFAESGEPHQEHIGSLREDVHEHSELNNLFSAEFHNELWRLPEPHKIMYHKLFWLFPAAVAIWLYMIFTERNGLFKRRERRGL